MKPITHNYKDTEYDAIEHLLRVKQKGLAIREWVTIDDFYVNAQGDVFYVELYNTEYTREEGHGMHDIIDNQEPVEYIPFLTAEEVKEYTARYEGMFEEKEPHWLVWLTMFAVFIALAWILLYAGQPIQEALTGN